MRAAVVLASFLVAVLATGGAAVARPAAAPILDLRVSPLEFSPNGDGVKDDVRGTVSIDVAATLTIEVVDRHGSVVLTDAPGSAVQPGTIQFHWNGRTGAAARGSIAPDGRYLIRVTAVDANGARAEAKAPILLDTKRPSIRWAGPSPVLRRGPLVLRLHVGDSTARLQLKPTLVDEGGYALRTGRPTAAAPGAISLRVARTAAARLTPGAYRVTVKATDGAGNSSTSAPRMILVEHPVRPRIYALFHGVGRRVALTFDDCNSAPAWNSILGTLERFKTKATFFCPGRQVLAYPKLALRTVRDGNAIGSHGWDHANFALLGYMGAAWRLADDRAVWWKLAHVVPTPYFRPPYGAYTPTAVAAAGRLGYRAVVLWSVDPQDWRRPGAAAIETRVLARVHPGSIVLMHVLDQTAAMLPSLLGRFRARGLSPATLRELDHAGAASPGGWPPYRSSTSGA